MSETMKERLIATMQDEIVCGRDDFENASTIDYVRLADRVIAILREPTEAMLDAAYGPEFNHASGENVTVPNIWHAMIDAA